MNCSIWEIVYTILLFGYGSATREIAQHMGEYFAKEIFEAKYGDLIDFR